MERLYLTATSTLEREAAILQVRIIHGTANDLEIERFCQIQVELGGRAQAQAVIDPRD